MCRERLRGILREGDKVRKAERRNRILTKMKLNRNVRRTRGKEMSRIQGPGRRCHRQVPQVWEVPQVEGASSSTDMSVDQGGPVFINLI